MDGAHDPHGHGMMIKDALVFLFAAGVVVPVFRAMRLPAVVGFLLAGLALGPYALGALADYWAPVGLFTISDPDAVDLFAELGVLFLLFLIGLELSFEKLWALRRAVFGAGAFQAGLSALVIALALSLMGIPANTAAIVGLALALSSTAIVMQILIEERRAATPAGRAALAILLFQDLLVAPILIFVGFAQREGGGSLLGSIAEAAVQGTIALVAIVAIGRFLLRRVFKLAAMAGGRDFLMALSLLTVVGAAVITASAGLSLALGAFLAGLLLGETEFKHQTEVDLEPFKGLLLGLFFMSVGMDLDLATVLGSAPVVLAGLVALLLVKGALAYLACRLFAGRAGLSLEAAFLLAPAGEFAFVILAAARAGELISAELTAIVAAIVGLSMLLVPALGRLGLLAAERRPDPGPPAPQLGDYADLSGHVIIAGFGRVGQAIGHILSGESAELVALDRDPKRIAEQRDAGWRAYLGDAARPEILNRAGAAGAALFIVTVDDPASAVAMVRAVRSVRTDAPILARARDAEHARDLMDAGATYVIPDAIEAGLQLAGRALREFGYASETVRDRLAAVRDDEYRQGEAV